MSVKLMSAEAIRDDLETIALTWPDGIPFQQVDRINALKAELKRRNEPLERPVGSSSSLTARPMNAMTTDELEVELRTLSTRNDEGSKDRFAEVRFELRRRAKALEADAPKTKPRSSVTPRELELPDDDDVEPVVPRRPLRPSQTEPATLKKMPLKKKVPTSVRGFSATAREDGTVLLEYQNTGTSGTVLISLDLSLADADAFCAMVNAASVSAAELVTSEG